MRKAFKFILKYRWIIILVFFYPIFISQLIRVPLGSMTIGKEGDWISFLGNYSGGIIGGIVALLVAKFQLKRQTKQEYLKMISVEIPILTEIILETEKIIGQLDVINNQMPELLNKKNEYKVELDSLKIDRWKNIDRINDPVFQENILKYSEAMFRTIEVFAFDVNALLDENIFLSIQLKKMSPKDSGFLEIKEKLIKNNTNIEIFSRDKEHYLNELEYFMNKTQIIKQQATKRKNKIYKILKIEGYYNHNELLATPDDFKVPR